MLQDIMGDEFGNLIELYIRDSDQRFLEINEALKNNDAGRLAMLIHSLKGASSNIRAADFAQHALRVELLAMDGKIDQLEAAVAALEADYLEVRRFLDVYVKSV